MSPVSDWPITPHRQWLNYSLVGRGALFCGH